MTLLVTALLGLVTLAGSILLGGFYLYSPASGTVKGASAAALGYMALHYHYPDTSNALLLQFKAEKDKHPWLALIILVVLLHGISKYHTKIRYARLNALVQKYRFTDNPRTYSNMSIEVAQEVEANIAEYEFPRLYQFAWISDFLRTATDPGVSRALIRSGHMVNPDPMIEHERLQATIHLMGAFMAYPVKSYIHSLVMARINEHHHRYGVWINSDDILYLIIHFAMIPGRWINRFGWRKLQPFEEEAIWVLWREIAVEMGVRYVPESLIDAKEWRKIFEKQCRWRCDENEQAGMAMLNEIVYGCPSLLKPFLRKVVVSILDRDIVHYCQMDKIGPSPWIRFIMFRIFDISGWLIRRFGLPRLTPYKRTFEESKKGYGIVHVRSTPYDTLPFYQRRTFWNMYGFGAIVRRLLGFPAPSPVFYSDGTTIEAMGAAQLTTVSQLTVEEKVRQKAAELETSPPGYRPAIGYQAGRLLPAINDREYGSVINRFPKDAPLIPSSDERFDKKYEQRGLGYSKIDAIEEPEDILAFDANEAYSTNTGKADLAPMAIPAAA